MPRTNDPDVLPDGPFDDHARAVLARCFSRQNADGGLPETFVGAPSGCWTAAEVYAAVSLRGLEPLCPPGAVARLEAWLLSVCERHGGAGLPYYPIDGPRGVTSRCIVDPSGCLVSGLRARHGAHPALARVEAWLAAAQSQTGGWGVGPGEFERVYSTANAVLALADGPYAEAAERGRAWLARHVTRSAAGLHWSYRPGVVFPSALMTQMASEALAIDRDDARTADILRFLLAAVEGDRLVEEDEFPTRDGRKMTFTYAPRLTCLASVLAACRPPADALRGELALDRALRALARYEYRARRAGLPVPELPDERLWHYVEFSWGYGGVREELQRLGAPTRLRYREHAAALRRELDRQEVVATAPPPLAGLLRRLWAHVELPSERLGLLVAATETLARLIRARMAGFLLLAGPRPGWAAAELERPAPGATRTAWGLWRRLQRLDPQRLPPGIRPSFERFRGEADAWRAPFQRCVEWRNRVAHRPPAGTGARAALAHDWDAAFGELLAGWRSLSEPPLVTVEEVGLPAEHLRFLYRGRSWRGADPARTDELVESAARLGDRVDVVLEGEDGGEDGGEGGGETRAIGRWVYTGEPADGTDGLVPLSPFVLRLHCPECREGHFFLLQHAESGRLHFVAPECGGLVRVRWPLPLP